ncbi:MAG: hypothetical protein WCP97_04970 [bacterium]
MSASRKMFFFSLIIASSCCLFSSTFATPTPIPIACTQIEAQKVADSIAIRENLDQLQMTRWDYIVWLYQKLLLRNPSDQELQPWLNDQTLNREQMYSIVVGSYEFKVYKCALLRSQVSMTATLPDNTMLPRNFWSRGYLAMWKQQTHPFTGEYFAVTPNQDIEVVAQFKNIGYETWYNAPTDQQVCLAIYKDPIIRSSWTGKDVPHDLNFGNSDFTHGSWISDYRVTCVEEDVVAPGELGTFRMKFHIPDNAPNGRFREDITLSSGKYWVQADAPFPDGTGDPLGAAHIWVGFEVNRKI